MTPSKYWGTVPRKQVSLTNADVGRHEMPASLLVKGRGSRGKGSRFDGYFHLFIHTSNLVDLKRIEHQSAPLSSAVARTNA